MIDIRDYYVYIATNKYNKVLYIGMTNSLIRRIKEHKMGKFENSFTKRYKVNKLVYFEVLKDKHEASIREKELKGWRRERKAVLIERLNPKWVDLSDTFSNKSGGIINEVVINSLELE